MPPCRPRFPPSSPREAFASTPNFAALQRDLTQQSAVNKRLPFPRISGAQSRLTVPRPGEMKRHKLKRSLKEKKKKVVVVLWLRRHYQRRTEEHAELSFIPVFFVNTKGRGAGRGGGSPPNESKYNNTETPATMEERRQIPTSLCPRRHRPQTLLPGKNASRRRRR